MNELFSLLEDAKIQFWTLEQIQTKRKEFYLCSKDSKIEINQSRQVEIEDVFLEVWTDKSNTHLGYSKSRLDMKSDLKDQIQKLIRKSLLASEQKWRPQEVDSKSLKPKARLCAHQFLENFELASSKLRDQLSDEILAVKGAEFNSAELFSSLSQHRIWSSNGFSTEFPRSKIYAEVCFSSSLGSESQEFLETRWAVQPEDLNFKELCQASVQGSQGLLEAQKMPAGTYTAQVKAPDLAQILNSIRVKFSGGAQYKGLPVYSKGSGLLKDFKGQPFEVRLNPHRDYGLNSLGFDSFGRPVEAVTLSSNNQVQEHLVSQKFSQYLGEKPTVVEGVLEIRPSKEEDKQPSEYLEILQFSGLFVDGNSMTFSSEIRLARMVKSDGHSFYVKGGNFSGSFQGNFTQVIWAKESQLIGVEGSDSVDVPRYAYLNDVSVS